MALHARAGKSVPASELIDIDELLEPYYSEKPSTPEQMVSFGTSGHRGTSLNGTFTEAHILAITQAICEYRQKENIDGPLYLGKDTHALSGPAQMTALEVLEANNVQTILQEKEGFTPTPVISHAILCYNKGRAEHFADGIVITPSHNPPTDGGFKYNPPNGGPADTDVTQWIQDRANELLKGDNKSVRRAHLASKKEATHPQDLVGNYVADLASILDMDIIRDAKIKIGVDPLGGASLAYWKPIAEKYGLDLTVTNTKVDARFGFMTLDHDGKIRMDCSSPYAMAKLLKNKDKFDISFGNDPDADRHGIVTRSAGLMNPNHYLSVAIRYLFTHRGGWSKDAGVGKTLVSSSIIDRIAKSLDRKLVEVPVGFKYFVSGLFDGSLGFGGEESAGASFVRKDGSVWSTDKDGLIMGLLAAEITARTEKDPGEHFQEIAAEFGTPCYTRLDAPATLEQKSRLKKLSPDDVKEQTLAGEPITAKLTKAPGNNADIGGLKVVTENGWFAARPSGTENIYKIYAESLKDEAHLQAIVDQAKQIVDNVLG